MRYDLQADCGALPGDSSQRQHNTDALNAALERLQPGDSLVVTEGETFHLNGGVRVKRLRDVSIVVDGTLFFSAPIREWPGQPHCAECPADAMAFPRARNVTFTSSRPGLVGTLDGGGPKWWGYPWIGYAVRGENRPFLFTVAEGRDVLFERILLKDAGFWTAKFYHADGLEIRDTAVVARRTMAHSHTLLDASAFNTDGLDVSGRNVWIHDVQIWNQDDCIAIKDSRDGYSENMLIERVNASGTGIAIGSISGTHVRNITIRDSYLDRTWKGIYLKFRGSGTMSDILIENVTMDAPEQWPIWIGPAQQSSPGASKSGVSSFDDLLVPICNANPCSLCWPVASSWVPDVATCNGVENGVFRNITLRDITINNPVYSPGVLLGDPRPGHGMQNVVFDGVRVRYTCDALPPWSETFSQLPTRVFDEGVLHLALTIVAGLLLLVVLPVGLCWRGGCCARWWRRSRRCEAPMGCSTGPQVVVGAATGVGLVLVLALAWALAGRYIADEVERMQAAEREVAERQGRRAALAEVKPRCGGGMPTQLLTTASAAHHCRRRANGTPAAACRVASPPETLGRCPTASKTEPPGGASRRGSPAASAPARRRRSCWCPSP